MIGLRLSRLSLLLVLLGGGTALLPTVTLAVPIPSAPLPLASHPAPAASPLPLPHAQDIPEEVLRTEIITGARSPINGEPLSAADYAELQAQLQQMPDLSSSLPTDLRQLIFLLQLRRTVRSVFPFLLR